MIKCCTETPLRSFVADELFNNLLISFVLQIMSVDVNINGGMIMVGDIPMDRLPRGVSYIAVTREVLTGRAVPLSEAFEAHGGETLEEPTMQFWGQGGRLQCSAALPACLSRPESIHSLAGACYMRSGKCAFAPTFETSDDVT